METYHAQPPANAVVVFNGRDVSNWTTRDGKPAGWVVEDGILHVVPKTGDIMTTQTFLDFQMHLEFRCPNMPDAKGQAKGNSGVFLAGRYEIQVLDSWGLNIPGMGDCGAFYNQHAPLVNACNAPMAWQTYDVIFRAARVVDGRVVEKVRATVLQNGQVIQNNVELPGVTGGALTPEEGIAGPLLLQDHGDLVCYRNIWILPLPLKGSDTYEPR